MPYTVLAFLIGLVSTMCINAKATSINDINYSCHTAAIELLITIGVALTSSLVRSVLTNYSYVNINISTGGNKITFLTRCFTGLGPIGNHNNSILGGLYFSGNRIPNGRGCSSQGIIQVEPGSHIAGVINMHQCREFSTMAEGVYTYIILNSLMQLQ